MFDGVITESHSKKNKTSPNWRMSKSQTESGNFLTEDEVNQSTI
jgi:hypothetical protein